MKRLLLVILITSAIAMAILYSIEGDRLMNTLKGIRLDWIREGGIRTS